MTLVVLLIGSFGYFALESAEAEAAFWFAGVMTTAVVILVASAGYRLTLDVLNPLTLGMVYFGLLFPFHGLVLVDDPLVIAFHGVERHFWFGRGLIVAGWGAFMLLLGFRSGAARRIHRMLPSLPFRVTDESIRSSVFLWVLVGLSVFAKVLLAVSGLGFHFENRADNVEEFMGFQFILVTLSNLSLFVMMVLIGRGLRERNPLVLGLAGLILMGSVAWGLYSGSRLTTLMPLAFAVMMLHRCWRPLRPRYLLFGIAFFVFIIFPLLTAYRATYNTRLGDIARDGAGAAAVTSSVEELFSDESSRFAAEQDSALETLAARTHGLSSLTLIMRYTPERHPYLLGAPFALLPLQVFVPRAIWPDKPNVAAFGKPFKEQYWGTRPGDSTSIAVSQLGDLWVNLHLFGVIVGCWLMGVAYRYLFHFFRLGSKRGSILQHALFAFLVFPAVMGLSSMVDAFIAGNIKVILVLMFIAWTLRDRSRSAPQGAR